MIEVLPSEHWVAELPINAADRSSPLVAGRSVHAFWLLIVPHFRSVLLPPQRRLDEAVVDFTWVQPADHRAITGADLVSVRRQLAAGAEALADAAADCPATDELIGGCNRRTLMVELAQSMTAVVAALLQLPDGQLAEYACRTTTGVRLHSWGAPQPGPPRQSDPPSRPDRDDHEALSSAVIAGEQPEFPVAKQSRRRRKGLLIVGLSVPAILVAVTAVWAIRRSTPRPETTPTAVALPGESPAADPRPGPSPRTGPSAQSPSPTEGPKVPAAPVASEPPSAILRPPLVSPSLNPSERAVTSHAAAPAETEVFASRHVAPALASSGSSLPSSVRPVTAPAGPGLPGGATPTGAESAAPLSPSPTPTAPSTGAVSAQPTAVNTDTDTLAETQSSKQARQSRSAAASEAETIAPGDPTPTAAPEQRKPPPPPPELPEKPTPQRKSAELGSAAQPLPTKSSSGITAVLPLEEKRFSIEPVPGADESSDAATHPRPMSVAPTARGPEVSSTPQSVASPADFSDWRDDAPEAEQANSSTAATVASIPNTTQPLAAAEGTSPRSFVSHRVEIRQTPWKVRLVQDAILPTQPEPVGAPRAIDHLARDLLHQRTARRPALFEHAAGRLGLAAVVSSTTTGLPEWSIPVAGKSSVSSGISVEQTRISWLSAEPITSASARLATLDHVELASLHWDANGQVAATWHEDVHLRLYLQLESLSGEGAKAGLLEWHVSERSDSPRQLQQPARFAKAKVGLELPLPPLRQGRGLTYTIALVDPASGWALTSEIEVRPPSDAQGPLAVTGTAR
jgi:hypothetical protein